MMAEIKRAKEERDHLACYQHTVQKLPYVIVCWYISAHSIMQNLQFLLVFPSLLSHSHLRKLLVAAPFGNRGPIKREFVQYIPSPISTFIYLLFIYLKDPFHHLKGLITCFYNAATN